MNDSDWYLVDRAGRRYGPYEREFVEQLATRQELASDTPLWHPGLARWQPAGRVLGHLRLPARDAERFAHAATCTGAVSGEQGLRRCDGTPTN